MRRHHMIAGGVKNWVDLTLHPSSEAALAALRADGWQLVAAHASPDARDFREIDYTAKVAIIVGAELVGPSPVALEQADVHVAIPMHGLGASVNVSVAGAVILFEAQRQRLAAGLYADRGSRLSSSTGRCSSGATPTSRGAAASAAGHIRGSPRTAHSRRIRSRRRQRAKATAATR